MFTGTRPCTCKRRHRDRHLCDASSTNVSDTQVKSVRATHREVSWFDPRDDQECVDHKLHLHRVFDQDAAACCDEHSRRIKSTSTVSLECNQNTRRVLESLPLSRLPSAPLLSISFYPTARALTTTTFLLSSSSSSPSSSFYFYPSSGVVLLDLPEVHFDCLGPIGAYAGDACVMIAHTALTIIYVVLSLRYVGTRKCMRCGITPDEEEEVEVEEVEEEEDEVEMEENDAALRMQPRGAVVDLQVIEADADAGVEIREAAHSGAAAASAAIVVPEVAAAAPGLEFEEDEARLEIQDVEDDGAKEEEDDDEVVVGQLSRLRALHRFIVVKGTLLTDLLTSVLTLTSYSGSSTVLTSTRTSVPNTY